MDLSSLKADLHKNGFDIEPDFSGGIKRFNREGKLNGWCKGEQVGEACVFSYGDWKTGEVFHWASTTEADFSAKWAEHSDAQAKLKEELQRIAAREAQELWDTALPYGNHTYLDSKKLNGSLYGARLTSDQILIPIRDSEGTLHSLQKIMGGGAKRFHEGGRIKGCFHQIGDSKACERIFLCEGFATGASIYLAFEKRWNVVCALNAGNLTNVAKELRQKYHDSQIIICADNDSSTPKNPGLTKAQEAAKACGGIYVAPIFSNYTGNPTDFNDLHVREGLEAVRTQIEASLHSIEEADLIPLPLKINPKTGKPVLPPQQDVANALLKFYQGRLVKQEKDLFIYVGTHWRHLSLGDHHRLMGQIQKLVSGLATAAQIKGMFELFLIHVPHVPDTLNMFAPNFACANFLNGTLHAVKESPGKYKLAFREHAKEDYLVNVLPFEYSADYSEKNAEFEDMLLRIFEGDTDREGKIQALSQMFGACIMPLFPHLFFLWGDPGTGKSTVIKIMYRLMRPENVSKVQPSELEGFNMETMAGKLVNFDADVDLHAPMRDSVIKKIVDRVPFRIRRKGIKDIDAPLPAIHIFGGNEIPRALDGVSKAHDRRWTFIAFHKVQAVGQYNKEYDEYVWEKGPRGIINFALKGLISLLESGGHYFVPQSGREKLTEWQNLSDPVGLFIDELEQGEIVDAGTQMKRDSGAKVARAKVWELFVSWYENSYNAKPRLSKIKFFALLRTKGFEDCTIEGVRYFKGLGTIDAGRF